MEKFNFDYDAGNDDLFVYLDGSKSEGAVEIGDFVFDFNKDKNLIAIQILTASEILSKLLSKIISLAQIKNIKADIINFRNMEAINLEVEFEGGKEKIPIIIPRVKEGSPVLRY